MPRSNEDPKAADSVVRITDFPGMSPGTDQHDNHPGQSWFQVNAVSLFPGELRARRGFQVVRFDQPARPKSKEVSASSNYIVTARAAENVRGEFSVSALSSYVLTPHASESFQGSIAVSAASAYIATPHASEWVRTDHIVSASSSYILVSGASATGSTFHPVSASSSYIVTSGSRVAGSFDLMGLF